MKRNTVILFLFFLSLNVNSQIVFDLSIKNTTTETIEIKPNQIIVFKNLLPTGIDNTEYSFEIELKEEKIPPFQGISIAGSPCSGITDLQTAYKALTNASDESQLANLIEDLKKEINKLDPKTQQACIDKANTLIEKTTFTKLLLFSLRNNQTITVTVKRVYTDSNGQTVTSTWVKIYKTSEKTPWHLMYGFTFVPNKMNYMPNYFTKADTTGNTFTITKLNNQDSNSFKNISPTMMFQWTPMKKYYFTKGERIKAAVSNNFYQFGITGGLSLNFANEVAIANVMAGPSIVIADNLSISFGLVFTPKDDLLGEYEEGQILKEHLNFDQLHEKDYMLEYFISLAFRFEGNPFKKKDTAE